MNRGDFAVLLSHIQGEERAVREAGQKEYAREEENAFANFERVADLLGLDRKTVLMVYALKHLDGIMSYLDGHESQREDVRGRIKDLRMYLALLWGMIDEEDGVEKWAKRAEDDRKAVVETVGTGGGQARWVGTGGGQPRWNEEAHEGGKILDDDTGEAMEDTEENRTRDMETLGALDDHGCVHTKERGKLCAECARGREVM